MNFDFGIIFEMEDIKELTVEEKEFLKQMKISATNPGTIVKDFNNVIKYLESHQLEITKTSQFFTAKSCEALNKLITHRNTTGAKTMRQSDYIFLNGIYLILRAGGFVIVSGTKSKKYLKLIDANLAQWRALSETEQYFSLLEIWLFESSLEIIEAETSMVTPLNALSYIKDLPKVNKYKTNEQYQFKVETGIANTVLLQLFGFISIDFYDNATTRQAQVSKIIRNDCALPLTKVLWGVICEYDKLTDNRMVDDDDDLEITRTEEIPVIADLFQKAIRRWFPNVKRIYRFSTDEFTDGLYVFKVSLGDVWRKIGIPAKFSLDGLCMNVLEVFEFDSDHLYMIKYKNYRGITTEYNCPFQEMEPAPFTTDVMIGDMGLRISDEMTFIFDFGDWWEFEIILEAIQPILPSVKKATLIESSGSAPKQYNSWDDDYDSHDDTTDNAKSGKNKDADEDSDDLDDDMDAVFTEEPDILDGDDSSLISDLEIDMDFGDDEFDVEALEDTDDY